jgi:hypothetical protein
MGNVNLVDALAVRLCGLVCRYGVLRVCFIFLLFLYSFQSRTSHPFQGQQKCDQLEQGVSMKSVA